MPRKKPLRLIHYSDAELGALHSVQAGDVQHAGYLKPHGLWVSVEGDDDWPHWCESENFHCGAVATELVLASSANILHLSTAKAIDRFTREFGCPQAYFSTPLIDVPYRCIDWDAVGEKYHGIVIAPYCWERRLTPQTWWYYGWDCASGCIWNMNAVASFNLLEPARAKVAVEAAR